MPMHGIEMLTARLMYMAVGAIVSAAVIARMAIFCYWWIIYAWESEKWEMFVRFEKSRERERQKAQQEKNAKADDIR